jgi:hypothetical protein
MSLVYYWFVVGPHQSGRTPTVPLCGCDPRDRQPSSAHQRESTRSIVLTPAIDRFGIRAIQPGIGGLRRLRFTPIVRGFIRTRRPEPWRKPADVPSRQIHLTQSSFANCISRTTWQRGNLGTDWATGLIRKGEVLAHRQGRPHKERPWPSTAATGYQGRRTGSCKNPSAYSRR